jgi:hypothetical protein
MFRRQPHTIARQLFDRELTAAERARYFTNKSAYE